MARARQIRRGIEASRSTRLALSWGSRTERVEATVSEVTQEDLALAELVREAQAAAVVAEQQLREGAKPC